MQIDGRVPDPMDNNDTKDIYAWQANVRPIPSRYACCYKVSITLRVMRINDTLDKEFMTFLLPDLFRSHYPLKGKEDSWSKDRPTISFSFLLRGENYHGANHHRVFVIFGLKKMYVRNHESSRLAQLKGRNIFFFFFGPRRRIDLIIEISETTISNPILPFFLRALLYSSGLIQ